MRPLQLQIPIDVDSLQAQEDSEKEAKAHDETPDEGAFAEIRRSGEVSSKKQIIVSAASFEETKSEECTATVSSSSTRLSEGEVDALIDGLETTRVFLSNILQADDASSLPEDQRRDYEWDLWTITGMLDKSFSIS